MRSKIKNKVIASLMLTAFIATNSMSASFAMDGYMSYNAGRPAIRSAGLGSSVSLKSGIHMLNGDTRVNLSLRDADVTQVLRMFADQAGMNIIFTPDVKGTVTLDLVDIPLEQAFNLVITTSKLYYDIQDSALIISTSDNAVSLSDRNQVTVLPVKYANAAAVAHFINVNFFGSKEKMKSNPGISARSAVVANPITNEIIVTGTDADVDVVRRLLEQVDKKPAITTYKVNHTTPAEMANAICTSLIPGAMFIGTDESTGGAAGIPTGYAADSSSTSENASSISVSGGQLACSFAAVNSDDFDDDSDDEDDDDDKLISFPSMGMTVTYFPTLGTIQIIGGSPHQLALIGDYIAANDRKTPQAYLEVQIVSLTENGSKTFDNQWQFLSKNFSFNAGSQAGGFGTNTMYPVFFAGHGFTLVDPETFDKETGSYDVIGQIQKWGTSPQLVYSVNYLISSNKARVLANPKILLTSGKTSKIDLSSEYIDTMTTQFLSSGAIGTSQSQKEVNKGSDNGITVEISSFISPDGYVTLDITPQYNSIADTVYDTNQIDILATLLQKRMLELKGIRVKDGETLVIGGMIQERENKNVTKIPFLGDIPVLGMFFRSTTTGKSREEMVMMLTPQIIVDTEDAVDHDNTL